MKKLILSVLVVLACFADAFAVLTTRYKSGCFSVKADGTVQFVIDYTGAPSAPANQELWIDHAGSLMGPYMPDYSVGVGSGDWTNYYILPAADFGGSIPECIVIQQMKDVHPTEVEEYTHKICRCETGSCNADFKFIQNSFNNGASIVPLIPCADCIYGLDYGAGEPIEWGELHSYVYSASGPYTVCLIAVTEAGEECKICKNICIDIQKEEGYFGPDKVWQGKKDETRPYQDVVQTFSVFPNPANGTVNIKGQLDRQSAVSVRMSNALGQEVLKKEFKAGYGSFQQVLSLDQLSNGLYVVTIATDGKEETHSITISK